MNAIKTTKITFKQTEAEWYKYHNTLREIATLQETIMNPFDEYPDENTGGGSNSVRDKTDPTAKFASRLITSKQLTYLTDVIEAVERVYNTLPDNYKELARLRYWNKNNELTWDEIAVRCNVSKRQAMRWRDEIIQATVEVLGWR